MFREKKNQFKFANKNLMFDQRGKKKRGLIWNRNRTKVSHNDTDRLIEAGNTPTGSEVT